MTQDLYTVSNMRQKEIAMSEPNGFYQEQPLYTNIGYNVYNTRSSWNFTSESTVCPSPDCVVRFPMNGVPVSSSIRFDQLGFNWFWIIELSSHFALQRQTAHLARQYAAIIIRKRLLLSKQYCYCIRNTEETIALRRQLLIIATTCVFMASKIEEVNPPKGAELAEYTSKQYGYELNGDDLIKYEMEFVTDLDWNLHPVTPYSWLMFLVAGECQDSIFTSKQMSASFYVKILDIFHTAVQLMDIGFLDAQAWSYLPSILAGAALVLVDAELDYVFVAQFLQLDAKLLYDCMVWLRSLVSNMQEWECDGSQERERWTKISVSDSYFIQHRVCIPSCLNFGLLRSDTVYGSCRLMKVPYNTGNGFQFSLDNCASPCSSDYCLCYCKNGIHTCGNKRMEPQVYHYKHGWQYVNADPNLYQTHKYWAQGY